jgi:putative transposase
LDIFSRNYRNFGFGTKDPATGGFGFRYFRSGTTYRRSGTLWEGRYRATVSDSERYLLTLMRYIELNPVRAGLVPHPQDHPWLSYRRNMIGMSGLNAAWLTAHEEYLRSGRGEGDSQVAYQQ